MKLSDKDFEILKLMVKFKEVSIDEIQDIKGFGPQTIKNSLKKINEVLEAYFAFKLEIDYPIVKLPMHHLEALNTISLDFNNSIDICKNERVIYILLQLIFERQINIIKISKELQLTKLTIMKDVNDARNELKNFNLDIENIPWKGSILKGKDEDILKFSIHFLMLFFIKKFESPYLNNIYGALVNPKNIEYITNRIGMDMYFKIKKSIKNILNQCDIEISQPLYYAFISSLIYIYLHKTFKYKSNILNTIKEKEKANLLYNILNKEEIFKDLNCSQEDLEVFVEIMLSSDNISRMESMNPNFLSLIKKIEDKMEFTLSENEKMCIANALAKGNLENMFSVLKPVSYSLRKTNLLEEIETKLESDIKKEIPNIYVETLYQIIFLVQDAYLKKLEAENKNKKIYIVDGSYRNFQGELLKKEIMKRYFVNHIEINNFLKDRDYEKINNQFDFVIYLDTFCDDQEMYKIPTYLFSFSGSLESDLNKIGLKIKCC